jgi:hypothetical protein
MLPSALLPSTLLPSTLLRVKTGSRQGQGQDKMTDDGWQRAASGPEGLVFTHPKALTEAFIPSTLISVSLSIEFPPKREENMTDLALKWQIHNLILKILRLTGLCYQLQVLDALSNRNAQRMGVNDPAE